jgi:cytidylate kinase
VLDGRDIGTVIFPSAPVKLYVTAGLEARARRRWLELQARGADRSLEAVTEEMRIRDAMDAARAVSPLRPADDAVVLDTTALDAGEVFEAAAGIVRQRMGLG